MLSPALSSLSAITKLSDAREESEERTDDDVVRVSEIDVVDVSLARGGMPLPRPDDEDEGGEARRGKRFSLCPSAVLEEKDDSPISDAARKNAPENQRAGPTFPPSRPMLAVKRPPLLFPFSAVIAEAFYADCSPRRARRSRRGRCQSLYAASSLLDQAGVDMRLAFLP